jgi:hypothetical protein
MSFGDLPAEFRETATSLRRDGGAEQPAIAWERAAQRIEEELTGHLTERLSLREAAIESGYTVGHISRMIRNGTIPVEEDGTVLRRDLPKKPGHGIAADVPEAPSSRVQLARAVAGGG